jgi:hypothetical protein
VTSRWRTVLLAALAVAAAAFAGCGADEEDTTAEPATTTAATAPQATAPAPTTAPKPTVPTAPKAATPEPTPAPPTPAPNACDTDKAISQLKFKGIQCDQAAAVANEWNRMQDQCSTIDDPNSPEGYNRTCTVQIYTCKAKRDVKSDARFVACAKGAAQINFTWAPP